MIININVKTKIATAADDYIIVCGNSDYIVVFAFDDEWNEHNTKTARFGFAQNGVKKFIDVLFEGNVCDMPVLSNTTTVEIGVYAGDLHTTTPCLLACKKSILCEGGTPEEPPENIYNQILDKCTEAVQTAASVEERANRGEFNGDDYILTAADKKEIAEMATPEIDRTFNPNSDNAQSGKAVAEALGATIKRKTIPRPQINLSELDISPIEHELKIACCDLYDKTVLSGIEIFAYNQLPVGDLVSGGLTLNGGIYTNENLVTTAYIEVMPKKVFFIDWGKTVRWVCLYDDKQNFIKQITTAELTETNSIFSVTNDTAYIRVTFDNGDNYFIAQGEKYVTDDSGIVRGIMSTRYTTVGSLGNNIGIQVEYNAIVNERLEKAIAENSERFDNVFNLLNAIKKMDIDVDRPVGNTITVEPETIYMCDSGSNNNLISFTQDSDNNKHTGRIVLMVVGKEYAYQNQYTLAYVVTLTSGTLTPKYGNWSFFARRKDSGYNTKITFPNGSSIVKIKNATN